MAKNYNIDLVLLPGLITASKPMKDNTMVKLLDTIGRLRSDCLPSMREYRSINNKSLQYRLAEDARIDIFPYEVRI